MTAGRAPPDSEQLRVAPRTSRPLCGRLIVRQTDCVGPSAGGGGFPAAHPKRGGKPPEWHEAAGVHHAPRRRSSLAARGARAAGRAPAAHWRQWPAYCITETRGRLLNLEMHRRCFPAVLFDLKLDLLPFIERAQSSALDRGDVDEYVFAACLRLDKSIALGWIEPLHGAARHFDLPSDDLG